MNEQEQRSLFRNHLTFLQAHRGQVRVTDQAIEVHSDRNEYTYAIPEEQADLARLLEGFSTIHLAPWGQRHRDKAAALGLKLKSGLSYMTLEGDALTWQELDGLEVAFARDVEEMEVFSEVQGRGFLESSAVYGSWAPWLAAANRKNIGQAGQRFYVGRYQGAPAGVVLTVSGEGIVGIYAVATKPEFRKKGISTALMKRAIRDAAAEASRTVTLQVLRGSYAESFYKKLGFATAFELDVFAS